MGPRMARLHSRLTTSLGLGAALFTPTLVASACGDDDDTAALQASLDDLAQSQIDDHGFIGLAISVRMPDGRLLRADAGYSDPTHQHAYDATSTEQIIGSVTKLYTSVLVMQLVEADELALDDTLDRWFDFEGASAITVRMLLQHTSGLGEYINDMTQADLGTSWSPSELVERGLAAGRTGAPPLATALYTNTDFTLLGLIVEAVTGKSWAENIRTRIAEPLGLQHTYYAGESERAEHLVGGWVLGEDGQWSDALDILDPSIGWAVGAIATTNDELMRFIAAFFDGKLFHDPATLQAMLHFDVALAPDNLGDQPPAVMGLGIMRIDVDGLHLEGHSGHIVGFNACAARDPSNGALVVVTSNDDRAFAGLPALAVVKHLHQ